MNVSPNVPVAALAAQPLISSLALVALSVEAVGASEPDRVSR
jgi:hypothetical protein